MSNINLTDKYRPDDLPLYYQYRKFKWEQFFIGFFGAMAILGILMKIWNPPLWGLLTPAQGELLFQILMPIGFIGEAIVFIMMGFLKGDGYYEVTPDKQDVMKLRNSAVPEGPGGAEAGGVNVEFKLPDNIQKMLEQKLSTEIDSKVTELSSLLIDDMERTRSILSETQQFAANLHRFSGSLDQFSTTLETLSDGLHQFENLNTDSLSKSVTHISGKLDAAGNQVTHLQDELKRLTLRFHNFNMFPGAGAPAPMPAPGPASSSAPASASNAASATNPASTNNTPRGQAQSQDQEHAETRKT